VDGFYLNALCGHDALFPFLLPHLTVVAFNGSECSQHHGRDRDYFLDGNGTVRKRNFSLRERDFTQAATALGVKDSRIIFRHILPNDCLVFVSATLKVAS
jgi:hypothetical protein